MRAVALFVLCVLGEARRHTAQQALFGAESVPPITQQEVAEGAQAARDDRIKHQDKETGYSLLMQSYRQEAAAANASTGRRLLAVPSPALSNAQLEDLSVRIITVLAGDVMKKPGTKGCSVDICGMTGRNHEGIMYPPVTCRVERPTACVSWGLSTANKHRGSDFLHEVLHAYTLRLKQQGKADWHFSKYSVIDEPFNDCLTQLLGGSYLNYG